MRKGEIEYTDYMTGEEYNHLREAVDWRTMTAGQAKRGLEHTNFRVVARENGRAVAMGRAIEEQRVKIGKGHNRYGYYYRFVVTFLC